MASQVDRSSVARNIKVVVLTAIVVASFLLSSLAWRHIESSEQTRIIVAAVILIGMYALMIFELTNRNLAALIGAAASVAAHACLVELVDLADLMRWLDLETLALLLGMMIIVNVLASTNLFDFLAVWCYQMAAGRFWLLVFTLSVISCFISAFVDNVSTMLLMAPTLIKLSELEQIDPRPLLIIIVIFTNVGGCATPVGDPPNLIIIGDPLVNELNITFGSFTAYSTPCVLLIIPITMVYLKLIYKSRDSFRLPKNSESNSSGEPERVPVDQVILGLTRKLSSLLAQKQQQGNGEFNRADGRHALDEVQRHIEQLEGRLKSIEDKQQLQHLSGQIELVGGGQLESGRHGSRLDDAKIVELRKSHRIKSRPLLIISLTILLLTVALFFVQSLPGSNLTLGWISLFAGLTLLVASSAITLEEKKDEGEEQSKQEEEEDNFELVVSKIEWSTLMFFAALFIVMEVMGKLGLLRFVGIQISKLVDCLPNGPLRSAGAITIILWASALCSALVDNVPFTSMMIKVLGSMALSLSEDSPLSIKPLVFALALGACLGGNGSLIGASANLITANFASRHHYPITFNAFFTFAAPIALLTLITANVYLILVFVVLGL